MYWRHTLYWLLGKGKILPISLMCFEVAQKIKLIINEEKYYSQQINKFLMEAMVATSRSVSQDKFLERENKLKYDKHIRTIDMILKEKVNPLDVYADKTKRTAQALQKSKETAKNFRKNEWDMSLKKENHKMLTKIWNINSNIKFDTMEHLQHVSGSNWQLRKRQQEQIKEENKRFVMSLLSKKNQVSDYKRKMKKQVKQYLQLKNSIRKFKFKSPKGKGSLPKSKSQRNTIKLVQISQK